MPEVATEEKAQATTPDAAPAAPPEATQTEALRAKFEQFEKDFHTAKSDWGRERAKLVRERDSFKAVEDLPEDARGRLADLAESREELAEKAGVDPNRIHLADYKTMKAEAEELGASTAKTAALEARVKELEGKLLTGGTPSPEKEREPMPARGTAVSGTRPTNDNADKLWLEGKITDEQYRPFIPR